MAVVGAGEPKLHKSVKAPAYCGSRKTCLRAHLRNSLLALLRREGLYHCQAARQRCHEVRVTAVLIEGHRWFAARFPSRRYTTRLFPRAGARVGKGHGPSDMKSQRILQSVDMRTRFR